MGCDRSAGRGRGNIRSVERRNIDLESTSDFWSVRALTISLALILVQVVMAAPLNTSSNAPIAVQLKSRQSTTQKMCFMRRKPQPPRPSSGASDEWVMTRCTEAELARTFAAMEARGSGTLFFDCGAPETTIRVSRTYQLASRENTFRLVAMNGDVILNGRGRNRILDVGGRTTVEIYGMQFNNGLCADEHGGAAILGNWGSTVRVVDCEFHGNRATSSRASAGGGAIRLGGGALLIWNSIFSDNRAPAGGSVQATGANLKIVNSTFRRSFSMSGVDGAGILNSNGGAVRCDRADKDKPRHVRICGCDFIENGMYRGGPDARGYGAALEVWGHSNHLPGNDNMAVITRSSFVDNGIRGEAPNIVMVHGSGNVVMRDLDFRGNRATSQMLRLATPDSRAGFLATLQGITFRDAAEEIPSLRVQGLRCVLSGVTNPNGDLSCP